MDRRAFAAAFVAASLVGRTAGATEGWMSDAFIPAERGSRWFFVESLDLRGHGRMALGVVGTYSYRSVAIRDASGGIIASPVRNQAVLHTGASFVFHDRLRLGFDVPLQIVGDGHAATVDGVRYAPASDETAVGDVRLAADLRLFGRHAEGFTCAIGGQLFVPAGSAPSFTGDSEPHARPRLMFAYERSSFAIAATTGLHLRGRDEAWAGGRIGSEAFIGLAGGVLLAHKRMSIGPELLASTVVTSGDAFRTRTTPIEALLGTRWEILPKIRAAVGAGAGLTHAYGAPEYRVLFALEWVPDDPLPPPPPAEEASDRDGDGVPDAVDACGFVPGEKSELPERNGCPPAAPAPAPAPAPAESP
jgi:hypothetical protein